MSAESTVARWLELVAELHRVGNDPARWASVFADLCTELDCPEVFGDGLPVAGDADARTPIARIAARARACATARSGRCGAGPAVDEKQRRTCLALLAHLDLALDRRVAGIDLVGGGAALDAIGRPLLVCTADGMLVHANSSGHEELSRQRWLSLESGRLWLGHGPGRWAWSQTAAKPAAAWPVPLPLFAGQCAELWCRPITRAGDDNGLFLLTLTVGAAPSATPAAALPLPGLTRRQRELAGLLRAGRNLSEAAREMGITRRAAIEHQRALFAVSHTRRLADLATWLRRLSEI